jgi:alpha-galactosidase
MMYISLLVLVFIIPAGTSANADAIALTPPMGWDTWCSLGRCGRDYCDEGEVKEIADAMADNGMKDVGFEYINLADCWADHRDANGELVPAKNRFPNGIASLADYVNSKGFKLGIV